MSKVHAWGCSCAAQAQGSHFSRSWLPSPAQLSLGCPWGAGAGRCPLCLLQLLLNFTLGSVISPTTSSLFD